MKEVFLGFYKLTYNDDIIISNLLSKMNVQKKSICDQTMNIGMIKQYSYGMGEDALFQNNGEGSHVENNKRVFKTLKEKNMLGKTLQEIFEYQYISSNLLLKVKLG